MQALRIVASVLLLTILTTVVLYFLALDRRVKALESQPVAVQKVVIEQVTVTPTASPSATVAPVRRVTVVPSK